MWEKCCLFSKSLSYIAVSNFNFFVSGTSVGEFITAVGVSQVPPYPPHGLGNIEVAILFGHNLEVQKEKNLGLVWGWPNKPGHLERKIQNSTPDILTRDVIHRKLPCTSAIQIEVLLCNNGSLLLWKKQEKLMVPCPHGGDLASLAFIPEANFPHP